MTDNHTPLPNPSAAAIPATAISAAVPNSGLSHPPGYVAVAGGYASVGGPGFPPPAAIPVSSPAMPTALPLSPVSGANTYAYSVPGAGGSSAPQQTTTVVVPAGGYQGAGVVNVSPGVVGGEGPNGAVAAGAVPLAPVAAAPAVAGPAAAGSTSSASLSSSSPNGAAASGGSSKSLKRVSATDNFVRATATNYGMELSF